MTTRQSVRKALFPVAGLGTRFLPATKSSPKEMLPIVDKPLLQYAVEEAVAAGIDEIIFVTSRGKRAIEDHFDSGHELERMLQLHGKHHLLAGLRQLFPPHVRYAYVRQPEALGLGHAVLCARALIGDEPFAVILPDDLMDAEPGVLRQMLERFESLRSSLLAVERVPNADAGKHGIVEVERGGRRAARICGIAHKPAAGAAPSHLALVGRFVLVPAVFDWLQRAPPGEGGEIELTDAVGHLAAHEPVFACPFSGRRFDCGSKLGYLEATVHFALKHPEVGESFARLLAARERADDISRAPAPTQTALDQTLAHPLPAALQTSPFARN
jgi:UTP--glucose-1-phosphate uridylyltransferase